MNELAFSLYCTAAVFDAAAVIVVVHDTVQRYRRVKGFTLPVSTRLSLMWNTHADVVAQITNIFTREELEQRHREGLNEINTRIDEETEERQANDLRLLQLLGQREGPGKLVLTVGLLLVGTVFGIAGNLAGTW